MSCSCAGSLLAQYLTNCWWEFTEFVAVTGMKMNWLDVEINKSKDNGQVHSNSKYAHIIALRSHFLTYLQNVWTYFNETQVLITRFSWHLWSWVKRPRSLTFSNSAHFRWKHTNRGPCVGPGHPSSPLVHLLPHLFPFYFFLSFLGFTYFLLLSIPFLSTRIAPLLFQVGSRRRRLNLGLVCFFV